MARTITVTAADVDLFHVAARECRDATQWVAIARANGLTDPRISGIMQLTIPVADPSQTGGVPQGSGRASGWNGNAGGVPSQG